MNTGSNTYVVVWVGTNVRTHADDDDDDDDDDERAIIHRITTWGQLFMIMDKIRRGGGISPW